jgi:hypothetical protein
MARNSSSAGSGTSSSSSDFRLFVYTSPYKRSLQTYEHLSSAFSQSQILGVQEEVQLREQVRLGEACESGGGEDREGRLIRA